MPAAKGIDVVIKVETTINIDGAIYHAEPAKVDSVQVAVNRDGVFYWVLDLNFGSFSQQTNAHILFDYVDLNLLREVFEVLGVTELNDFAGAPVVAIFNVRWGQVIGLYSYSTGKHIIFSEFLERNKIRA